MAARQAIARSTLWSFRLIVSQYVFLPLIGHVSQSKTSDDAFAQGRSDRVHESIAWTVTVVVS